MEALRLDVAEAPFEDEGRLGRVEGKKGFLEVSVGEIGDVRGVEVAIVPPTPVRSVGEKTLTFPVIEHAVGGTVVVGVMSAGLCGEPMAMTKGMLELDAVLGLREGEGGCTFVEVAESSRERRDSGAGMAELAVELLERIVLFGEQGTGMLEPNDFAGASSCRCSVGFARSGEFRIASAMTSTRGGVRRPDAPARSAAIGDSKRPNRGRGGRSGVAFPLCGSGTEDDRPRASTIFFSSAPAVRSSLSAADHSGVLGLAYS